MIVSNIIRNSLKNEGAIIWQLYKMGEIEYWKVLTLEKKYKFWEFYL